MYLWFGPNVSSSFDEMMEYLHLTPSSKVLLALLFEFFFSVAKIIISGCIFINHFFLLCILYLNVRCEIRAAMATEWLTTFFIGLNPFNFEHLLLWNRFFCLFLETPPLELIQTAPNRTHRIYFISTTLAECQRCLNLIIPHLIWHDYALEMCIRTLHYRTKTEIKLDSLNVLKNGYGIH